MVFAIHWHESALDLHVFPIPIPPPTSLSTRSHWVIPVDQPWALVSCIQPGLVIRFTLDNIQNVLFSSKFVFWGSTWTWILERIPFNPLHPSISMPYSKSLCSDLPFWLSSYCMTFFSAKWCHSLWHKQRLAEVQGCFLFLLPSAIAMRALCLIKQRLRETGSCPYDGILLDSQMICIHVSGPSQE